MNILVIGATGRTGREIVAQALGQGHVVTAFARNPTVFNGQDDHLRVVQGNVLDYTSVESAVRGHDAVLSARSPHARTNHGALGRHEERHPGDGAERSSAVRLRVVAGRRRQPGSSGVCSTG